MKSPCSLTTVSNNNNINNNNIKITYIVSEGINNDQMNECERDRSIINLSLLLLVYLPSIPLLSFENDIKKGAVLSEKARSAR